MLNREEGGELVIVRQTDHMAQTARMAERWGNARFPAPHADYREETIRAAALHDNGWRDWEARPTLLPETGRPRNLGEIERPVHAAFYRAGVERAVNIDPYTGLLVSLHAAVLYAGLEGWTHETLTPPVPAEASNVEQQFIAGQAALQGRLRDALAADPRYAEAVQPATLWPAYLRLRFWDQLSLYFLYFGMGERQIEHVPTTEGETTVQLHQTGPRVATADPWPFDRPEVAFPVMSVRVPDRRYESDDAFLRTLVAATPEIEKFTLHAI